MNTKTYTAWELCADWWWVGRYDAFLLNGKVGYETATATREEKTVRLSRLTRDLHQINRYVDSEQKMILVRY